MKDANVVAISGGFDPIHNGHINLIVEAKKLGNKLVCILNTDEFLVKKKGKPFYPSIAIRKEILEHIREIDKVVVSVDEDMTVCRTLELVRPDVFANGGDRKGEQDIPEVEVCRRLGIEMVFGVGGDKTSSSSDLTKERR